MIRRQFGNKINIAMRTLVFAVDIDDPLVYPRFKDNISLYLPLEDNNLIHFNIHKVVICDGQIVTKDYTGNQLNKNKMIPIYPEYIDEDISFTPFVPRDFDILIKQEGNEIKLNTPNTTHLTCVKLYFDGSFNHSDSLQNLPGWTFIYNPNDPLLHTVSSLFMYTTANNSFSSTTNTSYSTIYNTPSGESVNLIHISDLGDQYAIDITDKSILIIPAIEYNSDDNVWKYLTFSPPYQSELNMSDIDNLLLYISMFYHPVRNRIDYVETIQVF